MFTQVLRTRPTLYLLGFVLSFSAISSQAAQETAVSPTLGLGQPTALVPAASGAVATTAEAAAACTKHCSDSWGNSQTCVTQVNSFGKYTCTTKDKLCSTPCR